MLYSHQLSGFSLKIRNDDTEIQSLYVQKTFRYWEFKILYDTLIGYEIPAYTKVIKRKVTQAPRFYYFDVGLANYLMGRNSLKRGTDDFGHAFIYGMAKSSERPFLIWVLRLFILPIARILCLCGRISHSLFCRLPSFLYICGKIRIIWV